MLLLVGRAESKGGEGERSQQPIGNSNTSGIPFYEISTDDDNESCPSPNTSDTGESQNADRPAENIGDSGTYGTLSGLLPSNYFIPRNTPFGSGGLVRYSQSGLAQSVKDAELPISRVVPGQKRSAYVFEGRKEEAVDNRGKGKSQQGGEDAGALHLGHMPTATGEILADSLIPVFKAKVPVSKYFCIPTKTWLFPQRVILMDYFHFFHIFFRFFLFDYKYHI